MNTYWISLPCDLLSSLASFQCSLLHHLHLSSDLGLSKYVNQHSHLNLSRNCPSVCPVRFRFQQGWHQHSGLSGHAFLEVWECHMGSAHRLQSRHFWSNHTLGLSEMRSQAPQF